MDGSHSRLIIYPGNSFMENRNAIEVAADILGNQGASEIYVFGSAAEKDLEFCNDIDLAVRGIPPEKFYFVMGQVQMAIEKRLDLIDLDEVNPFTDYLKSEGKLLRVK